MLKAINRLDVQASAILEIVQDDTQKTYILKTAETKNDILMEKIFVKILKENNTNHLNFYEHEKIKQNQILLDYIENSPTIERNMNIETFYKWGELMKKIHNIQSDNCLTLNKNGGLKIVNWQKFLLKRKERVLYKNENNEETFNRLFNKISTLSIDKYSLIHGDLHGNNILINKNKLILFDKGSAIFYGDPCYDLGIFMMHYFYSKNKKDKLLRDSFIKGYGIKYFKDNIKKLELYTLFRCLERWGNKFEPQIEKIAGKLSTRYLRDL